jgi:hypothetical protein
MKSSEKIAIAPTMEGEYGKWRGRDWTEISEFLGIDINSEDADEVIAAKTRKQLSELRHDAGEACTGGVFSEASKRKITEIRRFVEKLIEQEPGDAPLWRGLLAIEDDVLFTEYVDRLLECMWT